MLGHLIYILLVGRMILSLPSAAIDADARSVLVVIGAHRALALRLGAVPICSARSGSARCAFPPLRRTAEAALGREGIGHAYLLLTSFRIDEPTTTAVYSGAFRAAARAAAAPRSSPRSSSPATSG